MIILTKGFVTFFIFGEAPMPIKKSIPEKMRQTKKFILLVLVSLVILSCKDEKTNVTKSSTEQMKEVIAIHDELMRKTAKFGSLVGHLSSMEDSTEMGLKYKQARIDLQAAHESMMKWMQGFGDKFDSDEVLNGKELSDQKLIWLNEEEQKIKALKVQIEQSLDQAEGLLEKKQ